MPESSNSPFSLISPHTNWSRDRKLFCLLSTDEFADTGLLSETAHLCGLGLALLCCHFYHGYQIYICQKPFILHIYIYICSVYQQEIIFCTATCSHPLSISLQSSETLITKKNLQFSFHFWSVQKHTSAYNVRLKKALLAFSALASLRMKPTVNHFEAHKHH